MTMAMAMTMAMMINIQYPVIFQELKSRRSGQIFKTPVSFLARDQSRAEQSRGRHPRRRDGCALRARRSRGRSTRNERACRGGGGGGVTASHEQKQELFFFFFAAECARAPVGAKTAERTLHLGSDYLSARPWWTCTRALAVQFLSSSRAEPGLLYT